MKSFLFLSIMIMHFFTAVRGKGSGQGNGSPNASPAATGGNPNGSNGNPNGVNNGNNGNEKDPGSPNANTLPNETGQAECDGVRSGSSRGSDNNRDKVWICHGTASETNPYVLINVDRSSTWQGHFDGTAPGHGKNNHPDIFPMSNGYDGAFYDCDCERPAPLPSLTVDVAFASGAVEGDEDSPINLSASALASNSAAVVTVSLSGIPSGFTVMSPAGEVPVGADGSFGPIAAGDVAAMVITGSPNFNGKISIVATATATLGDTAATGSATATAIFVPVNDQPEISATANSFVHFVGEPSGLPTIKVSDVDFLDPKGEFPVATPDAITLTVSTTHGKLFVPDEAGTYSYIDSKKNLLGSSSISRTGLPADLAAWSSSLRYVVPATFVGTDTIALTIDDNGNSGKCLESNCAPVTVRIDVVVSCPAVTSYASDSGSLFLSLPQLKSDSLDKKMVICHGTASDTNPYVVIVTAKSSAAGHLCAFYDSTGDFTAKHQCCRELGYTEEECSSGSAFELETKGNAAHGQKNYVDVVVGSEAIAPGGIKSGMMASCLCEVSSTDTVDITGETTGSEPDLIPVTGPTVLTCDGDVTCEVVSDAATTVAATRILRRSVVSGSDTVEVPSGDHILKVTPTSVTSAKYRIKTASKKHNGDESDGTAKSTSSSEIPGSSSTSSASGQTAAITVSVLGVAAIGMVTALVIKKRRAGVGIEEDQEMDIVKPTNNNAVLPVLPPLSEVAVEQ